MGRTILVVEDNPISRKVLRICLEGAGFTVLEAPNARSALELLQSRPVDIVIQDLMLPDMDGIALARSIRAKPWGGVPIIALSGLPGRGSGTQVLDKSFTTHLMKPIDPDHLLDVVRMHLPDDDATPTLGGGRRLLLVDDDPMMLDLGRVQLERRGFRVVVANDAAEALELARRDRPDAMISDVLMRGVDGFNLCLTIRSDPELMTLPVFLISSQYREDLDRLAAVRVGAHALLARTSNYREIAEVVVRTLDRGERTPMPSDSPRVRSEHETAIARQLDRQVELNGVLARRCGIQAAQLSVIGTIAEALTHQTEVREAMGNVLAACLDAAGISRGAVYLVDPSGKLLTESSIGYPPEESATVSDFFGHPALLDHVMAQQGVFAIPSDMVSPEINLSLLDRAGVSSLQIIPLVRERQSIGALVLGSFGADVNADIAEPFARAIALQIVKSLTLAEAFNRLAASEARQRSVMEQASCAVFTLTPSGKIVDVNQLGAEILGVARPALLGCDFLGFLSLADREYVAMRFKKRVGEGAEVFSAITIERPDKRLVTAEFSSAIVEAGGESSVIAIATDVTERNRTREQAALTDKLATVGTLAAGVAHEISNPIGYVLMNLASLRAELGDLRRSGAQAAEIDRFLGRADQIVADSIVGAERVREIVKGMNSFARVDDAEVVPVDVNQVLDDAANMIGHQIKQRATLQKDYGVLPAFVASPGKLQQVFVNLMMNAVQSFGPGPVANNVIKLSTRLEEDRIRVEVTDTGSGIPAEVRSQIFDPFFTTKPSGVGSGLGLSICHEIVANHGGNIRVESETGKGTTFKVRLPLQAGHTIPENVSDTLDLGVAASVLVVDDEEFLLRALRRMLASAHDVTVAEGGRAALELLSAPGAHFDMVITDLSMPDVSGIDLYRYIVEKHPQLARSMVFMTGGAFTDEMRDFLQVEDRPFLTKPFRPAELAEIIERVRRSAAR